MRWVRHIWSIESFSLIELDVKLNLRVIYTAGFCTAFCAILAPENALQYNRRVQLMFCRDRLAPQTSKKDRLRTGPYYLPRLHEVVVPVSTAK
jgi:hypothetical protein